MLEDMSSRGPDSAGFALYGEPAAAGRKVTLRADDPTGATVERFLERYRGLLLEELGDRSPCFYPYRRMLLWGRKR